MPRIVFVCIVWFCGNAYATEQNHECQGGNNCNNNGDAIPIEVIVDQGVDVVIGEQIVDVTTGNQTVEQIVGGTTLEASPNQIVNFPKQPDEITIKNTASAIPPDIFPTTPCFAPIISAGIGLAGFNAAAGGGKIDKGCVEREEIRLAVAFGWADLAKWRWCNLKNNLDLFESPSACASFTITSVPVPEVTVPRKKLRGSTGEGILASHRQI